MNRYRNKYLFFWVELPNARYQQLLDIAPSTGVEVEYEGPVRSYTTPRAMGMLMDPVEAQRMLADEELAEMLRKLKVQQDEFMREQGLER